MCNPQAAAMFASTVVSSEMARSDSKNAEIRARKEAAEATAKVEAEQAAADAAANEEMLAQKEAAAQANLAAQQQRDIISKQIVTKKDEDEVETGKKTLLGGF